MDLTYKCPRCGLEKPLTEFHRDKTKKSGHKSHCKGCVKNIPGRAEYQKRYRDEHREHCREWEAQYRENNREYFRKKAYERYHSEKGLAYREANRERDKEHWRAYYEANRDAILERNRVFRHSEKGRAKHQLERAMRRAHIQDGDRDITLRAVYDLAGGQCKLCGGMCDYDDYVIRDDVTIVGNWYPSIDHIIPLSLGGTHTWDNVQLAHKRCNSAKRNSLEY